MFKYSFTLLIALLSLVSCSDGKLSSSEAHDLVEAALQDSPMYETAHFTLGEVKYRTKKDGDKIKQIKQLESDDYLSVEELKVKKKWLSNDSVWVVNIKCTEKALPYITELKETRAKVKTLEYVLSNEVTVEQKNEKKYLPITLSSPPCCSFRNPHHPNVFTRACRYPYYVQAIPNLSLMVEDRLAAFLLTMPYHRTTLDYPKNDNPFYSKKSSMGTPYNRYNRLWSHLLGLLHYHAQSDEGQVPLRLLPLLDRLVGKLLVFYLY